MCGLVAQCGSNSRNSVRCQGNTGARVRRPAHVRGVNRIIDSFQPSSIPEWDVVADFVRRTVRPYAEGRRPLSVQHALGILAAYAAWVHRTSVASLDADALNPDLIDYYVDSVRPRAAIRSTAERERKVLRAIAGLPYEVDRASGATSAQPACPYATDEIAAMRTWALLQPERYRVRCTALVTLAAGAGLTKSEVLAARVDDIITDGDGNYRVRVRGNRARVIPVLSGWSAEMSLLASAPSGALISTPWSVAQIVEHAIGDIVPNLQRLRATWVITQLNACTSVPVLLAASGLRSADSLRRFLPYVDPVPPEHAEHMLRGAEHREAQA